MLRSSRLLWAAIAAVVLLAAACGSGSEADDAGANPEAGEEETGGVSNLPEPPEGAVAVVDGNEISEQDFEDQVEQVSNLSVVAEQLEGEQGDAVEPILRAQILSQLVVSDILIRGAQEDFGIEVSDAQVQERLGDLEDEAGGSDELSQQLEESGITQEMLVQQELPLSLTLEQVQDEVADDASEEPSPTASPDPLQPSDAEVALQEWAFEKLATAETSVRSDVGTWDPQTGQVQPPTDVSAPSPTTPTG